MDESRILIREALKTFDVIFFIPLTKVSPVEFKEDELRDNDLVYREEIDNIFKVFVQSFHQGDGRIFAADDAPPIIEIFGNPIERVEMTKLYITEEGQPYGEDKSLISDIYTGI